MVCEEWSAVSRGIGVGGASGVGGARKRGDSRIPAATGCGSDSGVHSFWEEADHGTIVLRKGVMIGKLGKAGTKGPMEQGMNDLGLGWRGGLGGGGLDTGNRGQGL